MKTEDRRTVERFCEGCEKLEFRGKEPRCQVFKEPYPLWGKEKRCWARPRSKPTDGEIKECYKEDRYRYLLKPGGGDSQDRTHKMFPQERMKDNKIKWKWDEL